MIHLLRFKLAAYARSHRLFQPVIALLAMLMIFYSTLVPPGKELPSYADSAGLLILVFAWAARGTLDTEPPTQRLISMTAAGRPGREIGAGLLAAFTVNLGLAAFAVVMPLLHGFAAMPTGGDLARGATLHVLALSVGTALGALASRPILPSPAAAMLALFGGYVTLLLVSLTPAGPFAVPIMPWMRAANAGTLDAALPAVAAAALFWAAAGTALYARLRRVRP
ncbi:hypothetical protein FHS43_001321 [Streptosporangium becharense]|uniref:ABC transporter permease n=1 Tax=Streptosporangium becharense TaxID=1816182 RepID=A0A7W9IE16_9ACTN|nr:hypothetical protein [Streptosporangium becharense]MBB2910075.1 hypothetical protein [Streptosporangium becharense]MBB5818970.1 hypothetical protein [Streptosporangium becharense]